MADTTTFTPYTTNQGDTWTLIAFRAYGDPTRAKEIIDANPGVPITAVLDAGIELKIPVLERASIDLNLLPPWKR